MKKLLAALITVVIGLGVLFFNMSPRKQDITLNFSARSGGHPFEFDRIVHANPGGEGRYELHDFRFFISNIVLSQAEKIYRVPESYHLIRFDGTAPNFSVVLKDVPLRYVTDLAFSVGLDPAANGSIAVRGDLDPNSRMAWNWNIGYKFLLAEGSIETDQGRQPIVYHVGFDENRRDLNFSLPSEFIRTPPVFDLSVDIARLFDGQNVIDMQSMPTIKIDRRDAKSLADNFLNMIKLSHCGGTIPLTR